MISDRTVTVAESVAALIDIANKAIEAHEAERLAKIEQADLKTAYTDFKASVGVSRIERDTPEWEKMLAVTKGEYAASARAKRTAANARRRLHSVIQRYRKGSAI